MSEYIIELTDDELNMVIATHGVEDCQLFGYKLTGEIVRCRDCRFCGKGMWGNETFPVCRRGLHTFQVTWDGFFAWGERRKE